MADTTLAELSSSEAVPESTDSHYSHVNEQNTSTHCKLLARYREIMVYIRCLVTIFLASAEPGRRGEELWHVMVIDSVTLSPPILLRLYTLSDWSNQRFLIFTRT